MSADKNLAISELLDFYGGLLTDKQRNVIELYYNEDFSLAEIAERENVTRQGVRDSIKRGEQTLIRLEKELKLAEKRRTLITVARCLEESAVKLDAASKNGGDLDMISDLLLECSERIKQVL
ncbi:MAG: YlxM family DNA-binding protein [Oscillospiraceae bacterium]|nr:YlxM family DNA-binding protein [Oscillospiraceae bacterium]